MLSMKRRPSILDIKNMTCTHGTRMVGHDTSRKGRIHGLYINITSDTTH